jgi:hypothetical protein
MYEDLIHYIAKVIFHSEPFKCGIWSCIAELKHIQLYAQIIIPLLHFSSYIFIINRN